MIRAIKYVKEIAFKNKNIMLNFIGFQWINYIFTK